MNLCYEFIHSINLICYEYKIPKFVGDTAKAVLRGKFITLNTYIRRAEKAKNNNLSFHFTSRIYEKNGNVNLMQMEGRK